MSAIAIVCDKLSHFVCEAYYHHIIMDQQQILQNVYQRLVNEHPRVAHISQLHYSLLCFVYVRCLQHLIEHDTHLFHPF